MTRYAANTDVPVDRSRAEIERVLEQHGARAFGYRYDHDQGSRALIEFRLQGREVAIILPLPERNDPEFTQTPTGKERKPEAALKSWEQACRSRWRALRLVIVAKLEAVAVGISTLEREFLADVVLPDGRTVWQALPDIREHIALPAPTVDGEIVEDGE